MSRTSTNTALVSVLAVIAMGCTPQSAVLSNASMVGYLSETTSFTLIKGTFDPNDLPEDQRWNIDCREFEDEEDEVLRLENPLDICGGNQWPPDNEVWLDQGAFRAFRTDLDEPWRGEGIRLNEGDLQVGFHHRMEGGGDFRFAFSIDPDFQPSRCVQQDDGSVASEPVDGDWVAEWSKEIDFLNEQDDLPPFLDEAAAANTGGRLYFLNARSFQFDPETDDATNRAAWSLPEEWRAGFARATFVDEDLRSRYNRFGVPELYILFDSLGVGSIPLSTLWWAECPEGSTIETCQAYRQLRNRTRDTAVDVARQIGRATPDNADFYRPIVHANEWRPIDGHAPGLDAWTELSYSWVMLHPDTEFDENGDLPVGAYVKGTFSIVFDGNESSSRLIVQGDFEVPSIRRERWGPPDLRTEKAEEAGLVPCGE